MKPKLEPVTGITIALLVLIAFVFGTVMLAPGFTADQRTMVITATVGSLGGVIGYWLNSTAAQAKKDAPPTAPSIVTTTVQQGETKDNHET